MEFEGNQKGTRERRYHLTCNFKAFLYLVFGAMKSAKRSSRRCTKMNLNFQILLAPSRSKTHRHERKLVELHPQESHNGGKTKKKLHATFCGSGKRFETRGFVYALIFHVKNWMLLMFTNY